MDQVTIQGIKANDHRILSRVITRIENDDSNPDFITGNQIARIGSVWGEHRPK